MSTRSTENNGYIGASSGDRVPLCDSRLLYGRSERMPDFGSILDDRGASDAQIKTTINCSSDDIANTPYR